MADIIDINVTETTEEVTINVVNDVIQVNINQVTGGGGSQTLQEVMELGRTYAQTISGVSYEFGFDGGIGYTQVIDATGFTSRTEYSGSTQGSTVDDAVNNKYVYDSKRIDNGYEINLYDDTAGVDRGNRLLIPFKTSGTGVADFVIQNNLPAGTYELATLDDIPSTSTLVPYTGATQDVNLGEFGLLTGNIEFDNTPTNIPTAGGSMYYNDTDGTVDLILKGGNVKLQLGQENVIRVVNKTATNINLLESNYQAVRVTGAQGQRLKVDLAQATTDTLSAETIGLVTETINNNQEGFITTSGLVRNINTTGSLQGETWADGDILYLSPTTAGRITKVKPTAPNHLVIIGYVVSSHATQGSIFVKVDNGYELDELHNVKITTATNNQALTYTSATDIWENKTIIEDSITNGVTNIAPSQNAVFDALALKANLSSPTFSGVVTSPELVLTSTEKGFLPNALTTTQRNAIASPTAGLMIFNTTLGYPEYFDDYWGWMPLYTSNEWKAKNGIEYFNDFMAVIPSGAGFFSDGNLISGSAFGGAIATLQNTITNRIGVVELATGTTSASGQAHIGSGFTTTNSVFAVGGGRILWQSSIRIPTLSTSGERFQFFSGINSTNNSQTMGNAICFLYDEGGVTGGSTVSPNFQMATSFSGVRTWTTSSIPVVANQFYNLKILINDNATSVGFYIDDVLIATHTTNIPTGILGLQNKIFKSVGTANRTANIDYIGYKQKFTTPR